MGNKLLPNVNISFDTFVNVFKFIQNVNMSFEICANVSVMSADSQTMCRFH